MPDTTPPAAMTITQLTHDLVRKQSIVTFFWTDSSERRLGLIVPFGTSLEDIHQEAVKAVRRLSAELAAIPIAPPDL